jgi:hypothetical protein
MIHHDAINTIRRIRRAILHTYQRLTRGWDDSDIWSLDVTTAKWIAPRLRRLRRRTLGHPANMTEAEWDAKLSKMTRAFEYMASDEQLLSVDDPEYVAEGLSLFAKHYRSLWW